MHHIQQYEKPALVLEQKDSLSFKVKEQNILQRTVDLLSINKS